MNDEETRFFASPACSAHELAYGEFGYEFVDWETARDVSRWRKAERRRLVAARLVVPPEACAQATTVIAAKFAAAMAALDDGAVLAFYWPFRGEIDLRPLMRSLCLDGARIALPDIEAKDRPLAFREWRPDSEMRAGVMGIPVPTEGARLTPTVVVAPLVGYDAKGYRLGYGCGYYDRTLAALAPRPLTIGVGLSLGEVPTIYPQPHDIPMEVILTETACLRRAPAK